MITPFQTRAAEIDAAKKTLEDATTVGAGFWVSYIFLMFYIAVSAGAVTHVDLLLENPVKLPFLNLDLPLLGFFFLAPILFIVMHVFTLSKLVMLSEKAKRFLLALEKLPVPKARETLRRSLPSNIFVQFMAGPMEISGGGFGGLLRLMGWITMAIAPVLLLLFVQVQFLPYHSFWLNQEQRMLLFVDLLLIWWLWRRALEAPMTAPSANPVTAQEGWQKVRQKLFALWEVVDMPMGVAASLTALIFSSLVVTFPSEWESPLLAFAPLLEALRTSATETMFGAEKSFGRWPYNTLQLEEFNIFEKLKLEDPDKLGGREFTVRLQERRLEGANLDFAKLVKADFREAKLQGAKLIGAQLRGAWLPRAKLQGASLDLAQLQGALLSGAQMQGATLTYSSLKGGQLDHADIRGGALTGALLQGTTLIGAKFQGGTLDHAQLQGARLNFAQMQAATLDNADLRGASFDGAQLQAASLRGALVWRTSFALASLKDLMAQGLNWSPISRGAYEQLRSELTKNIPTGEDRTAALDRVESLDCKFAKGKKDCAPRAFHVLTEAYPAFAK